MKQQWNSIKQRRETPWNSMKQHETAMWTAWNSVVKHHEPKINIQNRYLCGHRPWFKVFHWHETVCLITMKHTISSWFKCFMKHCFILIQGVFWPCFILIQHVSRCFTTMKQTVSLLIHPDSTCFITVSSLWFILFHADSTCLITVPSVGTSLKSSLQKIYRRPRAESRLDRRSTSQSWLHLNRPLRSRARPSRMTSPYCRDVTRRHDVTVQGTSLSLYVFKQIFNTNE